MLYRCSRIGLATVDRTIYASASDISSFTQGESAPSPFTFCKLMEMGVRVGVGDGQCDSVFIDLHYEGFDQTFTDDQIRIEGQLEVTMSQEPIETHPDFLKFAGYRGEEDRPSNLGRNGAVYEETADGQYRFAYFLAHLPDEDSPDKLNRFAGVSSWLYPQQTYVQTRMDNAWPSETELESLGKILESGWLDDNVPLLPQSVNWMYAGVTVRNIANIYFESRRTATASGPRGWIEQMYRQNYGGSWTDQSD